MKKLCMLLTLVLALTMKSHQVFAQSVTIPLMPGWNWISIPMMDTLDFQTAMGTVTPVDGDIIKSHWGSAAYSNGQWRGTISQFYPGYGYHYKSNRTMPVMLTFNAQQPEPQGNEHEYVDLGLPSGTLWAIYNVGADTPEEYGDYFAWGETEPKSVYNWSTYQYCNGDWNTLTKYCNYSNCGNNGFIDNLTILEPSDDAATANWGESWRMPTIEEWQELYNNTDVTWTTQNGMNGRLFTASNGNSIFLPVSGHRFENSLEFIGNYGYYWSSSLFFDGPNYAWYFSIDSCDYSMGRAARFFGYSVRPVRSAE